MASNFHHLQFGVLIIAFMTLSMIPRPLPTQAAKIVVSVTAPGYDLREAPVSVLVPAALASNNSTVKASAGADKLDVIAGQLEPAENGQFRLTFVARNVKANATRTYHVQTDVLSAPGKGVEIKSRGADTEFWINGRLFTRYDTTTGPNKPYFYPLFAPGDHQGDRQIVRHWPVENRAGQTQDHPHHRGLWFTHGALNTVDFWLEKGGVGKTVHTGYQNLQSGPVCGLARATTDWIDPGGQKIAEDFREVRVYNLNDAYVMDFVIEVRALASPLVWGDTKEGTLALRLADSMRVKVEKGKTAAGHIINSNGDRDGDTWGKAAAWCDYYGPVDGTIVGAAILDHPQNPRHPTYWHVRDYGLFAANPFGLHDFVRNTPAGKGDLAVPVGESITLRYRLLFHKGTPEQAGVAQAWQAFSQPPIVQLLTPGR